MKKIVLVVLIAGVCRDSNAQLDLGNYLLVKKGAINKSLNCFDSSSMTNISFYPEDRFYPIIESIDNAYKIFIGRNIECLIDTTKAVVIDKMKKADRLRILKSSLKRIEISYRDLKNKPQAGPDTLMDLNSYARDSIYEYYYSPVREEITKEWINTIDSSILLSWFIFLSNNKFGDDGLDAKYLTICFLKHPGEFADLINKKVSKIARGKIVDYSAGSSGFLYATSALGKDHDESRKLFDKLIMR